MKTYSRYAPPTWYDELLWCVCVVASALIFVFGVLPAVVVGAVWLMEAFTYVWHWVGL